MNTLGIALLLAYATLNAFLARRARDRVASSLFATASIALIAGAATTTTPLVVLGLLFASAGPLAYGHRRLGRIRVSHHVARGLLATALLVAWLAAN